jgi:diguanylate cyclase (GGDEF)-like protein
VYEVSNGSRWRSSKTRAILLTFCFFFISIWTLTGYSNFISREEIHLLLSDQQSAIASYVAGGIGAEFKERKAALELIASGIDATLLDKPASVQNYLQQRPILEVLFNTGVFVTRLDGTAIAEVPLIGRVGLNYMDRDHIAAALLKGEAIVGKPVIGKVVRSPSFAMTVPIRDSRGKVIGALAGITDLSKPGFLDLITENKYGKTGGYSLTSTKYRLIITSSDKRRIMEALPERGRLPALDRMLDGYEDTYIAFNALGSEVVITAKSVAVTDWHLVVSIPTEEAFAPIRGAHRRLILVAILISLLAVGLTWWSLGRHLTMVMAFHDPLTQLANLRLLQDRLDQAMASSRRSAFYIAVIALDLDKFKTLNDTHGHAAGDLLLIEAARRMRACVREIDTVARTGGDEFVIILGELDYDKDVATSQARVVAEKIRISLSEPYVLNVTQTNAVDAVVEHQSSASIGVAVFRSSEASKRDVLKFADVAMYKAKSAGRNAIVFHGAFD